ncbi:MAG: zf-TFIIB domain-containing protein [Candidatus Binatia bacterium]
MLCPHCNTTMHEVTKSGVLIDICPDCKGTWLDRGELEKILNRAREVEQEWEEERARYSRPSRDYDDDDDRYERRYDRGKPYKKKRWTEIFDIFD